MSIEMIKPEKLDRSLILTGAEFVDVPAMGKKDFELKFFSFKEGPFAAKVEYMYVGLVRCHSLCVSI